MLTVFLPRTLWVSYKMENLVLHACVSLILPLLICCIGVCYNCHLLLPVFKTVHAHFLSTGSPSVLQPWYFLRGTCVPHIDLPTFLLQTACIHLLWEFWLRLKGGTTQKNENVHGNEQIDKNIDLFLQFSSMVGKISDIRQTYKSTFFLQPLMCNISFAFSQCANLLSN